MPTTLLFLNDSYVLNTSAFVLDIKKTEEGKEVLILDQTVFYPQGGGQPFDKGRIVSDKGVFFVDEVRFVDGLVYHIGLFERGLIQVGEVVHLSVDEQRRSLNRRNHTAGHIIDIAIKEYSNTFVPVKGFHFSQGAYVEYQGLLDESKREELKNFLKKKVNELVQRGLFVSSKLVQKHELQNYCDFVPSWLPENKPIRIVQIGEYKAHPCGGTHVKNTKEIGAILIEKITTKKGNTRISYTVGNL